MQQFCEYYKTNMFQLNKLRKRNSAAKRTLNEAKKRVDAKKAEAASVKVCGVCACIFSFRRGVILSVSYLQTQTKEAASLSASGRGKVEKDDNAALRQQLKKMRETAKQLKVNKLKHPCMLIMMIIIVSTQE